MNTIRFRFHPEGMFDSGPMFQDWVLALKEPEVPQGRLKQCNPSTVPSGLKWFGRSVPKLKLWAIIVSPFGRMASHYLSSRKVIPGRAALVLSALLASTPAALALPRIKVLATGGTIAG